MSKFTLHVASDVIRDGLGVELVDPSGETVAEVFRADRDHTIHVSTYGLFIPLQELERMLTLARERLDPFEDGTPLAQAQAAGVRRVRADWE